MKAEKNLKYFILHVTTALGDLTYAASRHPSQISTRLQRRRRQQVKPVGQRDTVTDNVTSTTGKQNRVILNSRFLEKRRKTTCKIRSRSSFSLRRLSSSDFAVVFRSVDSWSTRGDASDLSTACVVDLSALMFTGRFHVM